MKRNADLHGRFCEVSKTFEAKYLHQECHRIGPDNTKKNPLNSVAQTEVVS